MAETGAAVPSMRRLEGNALSLGAANAFDYATQFLLPVVLVRFLDGDAFGQYRLLWLAAGTILVLATLAMPASLYYFLPRSEGATKRLYINQTLIFMALGGLIAGWAVSSWNPWLPEKLRTLAQHGAVVPAFVLLWVVASLLDLLPTVEERVTWQARATVSLAALRAVAVSLAAVATRELGPVLLTLLGFVVFKAALLLAYVARYHGLRGPLLRGGAFADQFRHTAPFGVAGALFGLRAQADQWVAAALFSLSMFASFSIGAVLSPLVHLFRVSVNLAFLPSMSRQQAAGDLRGMLELNGRANVIVGALLYPLLAFIFVFAEEIVTIVYTAAYLDAAPVMRIYIVGLAPLVVEIGAIMLLLRQGMYALWLNALVLVVSVALSWFSAHLLGLPGAAVGSVAAIYIAYAATLRRIAQHTGIPVRQLQDWRRLGLLLACASLAGALAWGMVRGYFGASGPWVRVVLGAACVGAIYATAAALSGVGRGWLAAVRNGSIGSASISGR